MSAPSGRATRYSLRIAEKRELIRVNDVHGFSIVVILHYLRAGYPAALSFRISEQVKAPNATYLFLDIYVGA